MTGSGRYSRLLGVDATPPPTAFRRAASSSRVATVKRNSASSQWPQIPSLRALLGLVSGLRRTSTAVPLASSPSSAKSSRAQSRPTRAPELYVIIVYWTKDQDDDRNNPYAGSPLLGPIEGQTNAEHVATNIRMRLRAVNKEFYRVAKVGPIRDVEWLMSTARA